MQKNRQNKPNAALGTKEIEQYLQPDETGLMQLKTAISLLNLSARAYYCILKVAQRIANVAGEGDIRKANIAEAVNIAWRDLVATALRDKIRQYLILNFL